MNEPMQTNVDPIIERQREIFFNALEKPSPAERAAYLDGACGDDPALRAEVELLLQHHTAGSFLEHPALEGERTLRIQSSLSESPGTMIGRYKLLQKIGEGGCGVVYMAEQEEPVRRRVALKVIKLGMDTKSVIARFEAERQALALMDHPNIAKVFDGGATDSSVSRAGETANRRTGDSPTPPLADTPSQLKAGRPYFVMELVRGVKITDYCDEKNLSTQQRLDLFVQVCQAIQHAHQKGIIHRDIKPSNILVTVNDGVAVPKVIDFGIAKATTDQRLTDKTVFTAFEQFIGTPAYMSPEQAEVTSVDVDTRSDIYSLGVLLYELLTGKTPFDAAELLKIGLDEMRRTIREKEPERPSTRLTQELVAVDASQRRSPSGLAIPTQEEISADSRRRLRLKEQIARLRGDLDWIVMKCLEKERARRYETANGLAMDIQRHLSNEPVVACPPSNLYRFQKMVRRNKLAVSAGAGISAALVIGLAVALWQGLEKTRAYNRAVVAEKAAQTEAQILKDMLEGAGPEVAKGRDATILLEILDKTAERISNELTNQPDVEADLQNIIGSTYRDLGQYKKAELILRRALAANKRLHPEGALAVRDSLKQLSGALYQEGSLAESEVLSRESLALTRKLLGNEHADVVSALNGLTENLTSQGKFAEAKVIGQEALALTKKVAGLSDSDLASPRMRLAEVDRNLGNYAEAEAGFREAVAMMRKAANADNNPDLAAALNGLANVLADEKKFAEAEEVYREGLALDRRLLGEAHPQLVVKICNLAGLLAEDKKYDEAERLGREAVELAGKLPAGNEKPLAFSLHTLAETLRREKKFAEAEDVAREGLAAARKVLADDPVLATVVESLALILVAQAKYDEAESLQREALAIRRKKLDPQHPQVGVSLCLLGEVLNKQRQFAEAEDRLREALAVANKFPGSDYMNPTRMLEELNKALAAQGKPPEANKPIDPAPAAPNK